MLDVLERVTGQLQEASAQLALRQGEQSREAQEKLERRLSQARSKLRSWIDSRLHAEFDWKEGWIEDLTRLQAAEAEAISKLRFEQRDRLKKTANEYEHSLTAIVQKAVSEIQPSLDSEDAKDRELAGKATEQLRAFIADGQKRISELETSARQRVAQRAAEIEAAIAESGCAAQAALDSELMERRKRLTGRLSEAMDQANSRSKDAEASFELSESVCAQTVMEAGHAQNQTLKDRS